MRCSVTAVLHPTTLTIGLEVKVTPSMAAVDKEVSVLNTSKYEKWG